MRHLCSRHAALIVARLAVQGAFPEKDGGSSTAAECDGCVDGGDRGRDAGAKEALELVHVVDALATAATVLAEDRIDAEAAWTETQHERVLGAHGRVVLGVARDGKVDDALLVLVPQQAEQHKRHRHIRLGQLEVGARAHAPPRRAARL
ncbi:hypothetical protein L1887_48821 [Cichorium endivia]|nr:hypothetical protein L1887_48821 [Cichorium endivia]